MGSLFETAQMIFFELVILKLRPRFNETSETMRARHTNLEVAAAYEPPKSPRHQEMLVYQRTGGRWIVIKSPIGVGRLFHRCGDGRSGSSAFSLPIPLGQG